MHADKIALVILLVVASLVTIGYVSWRLSQLG